MNWFKKLLMIFFLAVVTFYAMCDEKEDAKNLYNQGKSKLETGDIDGAIVDLENVFNSGIRPYNLKAQNLLVEALDKKGQKLINNRKFDEALDTYKRAYKLNPNDQNIKNKYYALKDGSLQKSLTTTTTTTTTTIAIVNSTKDTTTNTNTTIKTDHSTSNTNQQVNNEEVKKLQKEIEEQKKVIDRLERQYIYSSRRNNSQNNAALFKQNEAMLELLKSYNTTISKLKEDANNNKAKEEFYQKQLEEQRILLAKQQTQFKNIIIIAVFSVLGFIVLLILFFFILWLIGKKRNIRQKQQYTGYEQPIIYNVNQNEQTALSFKDDYNQSQYLLSHGGQNTNIDSNMYKDLLKMDRLNKLQEQIRRDNIQWDTVREYIYDLEKDIRTEILKLVEMKLESGEIMDFSAAIEVLFPFLTDGDDYLREKSSILMKKSILEVKKDNETGYNYDEVNKEIVQTLKEFAKKSDKKTGRINHSINVANYARGIAKVLNFSKDDQELLFQAGLAHDLGFLLQDEKEIAFIAMHKDIEDKHVNIIKKHQEKSIEFLKKNNIELPKKVLEGILYHHERLDGSGYPNNTRMDNIPIYGKILGIADSFEAMTSKRVYRDKVDFSTALAVLKNQENKFYDAKYVEALIEFLNKSGKIKE